MSILTICDLGPTLYREGLAIQEMLVAARAAGRTGDWLLFPEHEPVLTLGRGGSRESLVAGPEELARRGIEVFEVSRGGDMTWHGPGQLVGYPICDLTRHGRDLHGFLRGLEAVLVETLESHGIQAATIPGRTGVWTGGEKIGSIGIAVRRWVSYHGFALNVAPDLQFFELIHPCGLRGIQMTSMAARLGAAQPSLADVRQRVAAAFVRRFGYAGARWVTGAEVRRGLPGDRPDAAATPDSTLRGESALRRAG